MSGTYIIAEIGTSHGGDLNRAAELIQAAAESGADCAKFQYVIANEIVHPASGLVDLPGGPVPLYDRFAALEREPGFYLELRALCDREEIDFLCTPFGPRSLKALLTMQAGRLKIASPEVNHVQLLDGARESGLPTFLSTGVARLSDIEFALRRLGPTPVTLLHCVTSYPAPEPDYNLRLVDSLARIFGRPVGVSDHSSEISLVPRLAAILGATALEKHFTLDRSGDGLDDPIAAPPAEFKQMTDDIHAIEARLLANPEGARAKLLSEYEERYGADRVEAVLGDGVKRLAPSEEDSYATTRRSLHVVRDMKAGDVIGPGDVAILRSEGNLSPGMEPRHMDDVIGLRLSHKVPAGEGLVPEHFVRKAR